jgi:hypothetical protein
VTTRIEKSLKLAFFFEENSYFSGSITARNLPGDEFLSFFVLEGDIIEGGRVNTSG